MNKIKDPFFPPVTDDIRPEMAYFLVGKLGDDVTDERAEVGLLGPNRLRAVHGEIGSDFVEPIPEGAPEEELGLQVLQIQRELEEIDVALRERLRRRGTVTMITWLDL